MQRSNRWPMRRIAHEGVDRRVVVGGEGHSRLAAIEGITISTRIDHRLSGISAIDAARRGECVAKRS